ncbi:hypothetical protein OHA21_15660 [Actinoplanes sp. NBC_00393]|uniref:acyl-CoA thioesterase n=1 Tax=Actinoplanes sp. NBC_00393 TaxID=2975953 RepID=UPI002E233B70
MPPPGPASPKTCLRRARDGRARLPSASRVSRTRAAPGRSPWCRSPRHSDGPAVTAAMDETALLQAVRVGDVVHVTARVTWAGRSSMEVAVKVTADRWDRAVPATNVVTSHLVMVAVDDDGKPRPVPPLQTESAADRHAFRQAEIHRRHRLALRQALADSAGEEVLA